MSAGNVWRQSPALAGLFFAADDRALCLRRATLGGVPTYTDLLTCLELERDARNVRSNTEPKATGQGDSR